MHAQVRKFQPGRGTQSFFIQWTCFLSVVIGSWWAIDGVETEGVAQRCIYQWCQSGPKIFGVQKNLTNLEIGRSAFKFFLTLIGQLLSTSYSSLSQICCFSCISPSCMPIVYYKVTVMIKSCFNLKSARYTNKDQILKIGQILDISDPNPVWTKIGHPKFFSLGLGWYWSENFGKMTPLIMTHF